MERLLQTFETPFTHRDGDVYDVYLYGRSRPADTWQGWLVFSRRGDGTTLSTDVETTQPSADAVLYWATGLSDTYFDGAFERARRPASAKPASIASPPPLRDASGDRPAYLARLSALENAIIRAFARRGVVRLSTKEVMDELPHAHADVVRALEDLEKQGRLLVRQTEGGTDWLLLTAAGAIAAGV